MNIIQKAKEFLSGRRRAYLDTFDNEQGRKVLSDIARFCRAHESTMHPEQRVSDALNGRREVWLRIQHHLNLSEEELWDIYRGGG